MSGDPNYFDAFFADIGEGSLFEAILRGHLWIEGELIRSLEAALPFPARVGLDRLSFNSKVDLVAAHGLMAHDEAPGFHRFNAIRNRLAHQLGRSLSETDEADLLNSLGRRHREHIEAVLAQGLQADFPFRIKYAITGMCVVLQTDRQRMQEANQRLREAARRLLGAAKSSQENLNSGSNDV